MIMKVAIVAAFFLLMCASPAVADGPGAYANALVISSSQDRDIAVLVAESRGYGYHETLWGTFSQDDIDAVLSEEPDMLIIIGGQYAVPERAEELGIESVRIAGFDRIETGRLALNEFFDFDAGKSYIFPSGMEVSNFLKSAQDTTAYIYIGESDVSRRWGLYYKEKLAAFFKEVRLVESGSEAPLDPADSLLIGVGNFKNNEFIAANWHATGFPEEVSMFPLIFLSKGDRNIMFITGSDQNVFFTQKSMEEMRIVKHDTRGLLVFGAFTAFVIGLIVLLGRRRVLGRRYSAFLLVSFPLLVYFYVKGVPGTSGMQWDSLYVYFDGALSMYFLDKYDTILNVRNLPGTSLLTYLFLKLTGPTDTNAYYLQGMLFSSMILSVSLVAYRLYGASAGVLAFLLMASNPYLLDARKLFGSDMIFVSLLSVLLLLLFFFNPKRGGAAEKSIFSVLLAALFCLLILVRSSGFLLFLAVLSAQLFRKEKIASALPFVAAVFFAFGIHYILTGDFGSSVSTYFTEVGVRTGFDLSYSRGNLISAVKHSAILVNYVLASLIVYRLYAAASGRGINAGEVVLLTFAGLHIIAMSLWPGVELRYAIPLIPVLTIYASGAASCRDGWAHRVMMGLLALGVLLNVYPSIGGGGWI